MRIALCQINPTVGDLKGNCEKIASWAKRAAHQGATVAVFPELALCGYPPRDLLERPQFIQDSREAVNQLCSLLPASLHTIVGSIYQTPGSSPGLLHNSAAYIHQNTVTQWVHKRLLPTYDVFDEHRYFVPGGPQSPLSIDGAMFGISVCEDAWNDVIEDKLAARYQANPLADLVSQGADVIVNLSASPFAVSKFRARTDMFAAIAKRHQRPLLFVNQVGGNDDLIFDGHTAVFGPDGRIWQLASPFKEDMLLTDLSPSPVAASLMDDDTALREALILGTRDYAHKCGFDRAVLGLSGGIDSALCAVIAAKALGADNVLGVGLSTRYTSQQSVDDAIALAQNLGIQWKHIDIEPVHVAYESLLAPIFAEIRRGTEVHATFENVQSRIRGATLMAISNRCGHLLLSTGNKSEIAMGYCTLYGDMAGGLAVLSDVPKTVVYRLAQAFNRDAGHALIPQSILQRAPSAELRPNQKDIDSLPPYEVLDPILEDFIENGMSFDAIVDKGFDAKTVREVITSVIRNEYKRRQMPPGLIVTRKAFGPGRRYPIAQRYNN